MSHGKFKKIQSRKTEIKISWIECSDPKLLPTIESALIKYFNPELNARGKQYTAGQIKKRKINTKLGNCKVKKLCINEYGNFTSPYAEPLASKPISVRLPVSMDAAVRELAGDELSEWIRGAIAARLEQEKARTPRAN